MIDEINYLKMCTYFIILGLDSPANKVIGEFLRRKIVKHFSPSKEENVLLVPHKSLDGTDYSPKKVQADIDTIEGVIGDEKCYYFLLETSDKSSYLLGKNLEKFGSRFDTIDTLVGKLKI